MQAVAGPYPVAAFEFVRLGLAHTSRIVHGEPPSRPGPLKAQVPGKPITDGKKPSQPPQPTHLLTGAFLPLEDDGAEQSDDSRHVSGQQLCEGLRDFAIKQYGLLAGTVLRSWGMTNTGDFGNIVFAMIAIGLFRKTEEDTREEFDGVYSFDQAFPDVLSKRAGS
jgi:uncharacterized repeat protein (TIGR04138 family)